MLDQMRLMNFLAQLGQNGPTTPNQGVVNQPPVMQQNTPFVQNDVNNIANGINEQPNNLASIFQPQHSAQDAYSQQLGMMPSRDDFQPSKTRQFLSALATLGSARPTGQAGGASIGFDGNIAEGMKTGDIVRNKPYYDALGDWNQKLKPLGDLAEIEGRSNVNAGNIENDRVARELQRKNNERLERKDDDMRNVYDRRATVQEANSATNYYRSRNPNSIIKNDDSGYMVGIHPQTLKSTYILDSEGKKIKSSLLTDEQKLNLGFEISSDLIGQRGDETRETNKANSDNILDREGILIGKRGAETRTTNAAKPATAYGGGKGTSISPTQRSAEEFRKAQEARNTHDEWKDYIIMNQGKTFDIVKPTGIKPSGWKRGDYIAPAGNDKTFRDIQEFIYGKNAPKVGDVKTFPNGNKGRYDGTRWVKEN